MNQHRSQLLLVAFAAAFVIAHCGTGVRTISVPLTATTVTLSLPPEGAGGNATLTFDISGSAKRASLLYTKFEEPVMLLPGRTATTVMCVYDFDLGFRVLVFDYQKPAAEAQMSRELRTIVPSTDVDVRTATAGEIADLITALEAMPDRDFRRHSVWTLGRRFWRVYPPRHNVLERLRFEVQRLKTQD